MTSNKQTTSSRHGSQKILLRFVSYSR